MTWKQSARSIAIIASLCCSSAFAQLAGLPTPRLLTVMPMGGQAGSTVEVAITGTDIDDADALRFSDPKITAKAKTAADGKAEPGKFVVSIAPDAARGICDVRAVTHIGISSARAFAVGTLPEVTRAKANTALETALELKPNSVCNASVTAATADFYSFQATKGKRVVVDCSTADIDSRLIRVLIITDSQGRDLVVNRRGGPLEFTPPADGKHFIKVHSLTYEGGAEHFYRLALLDAAAMEPSLPKSRTTVVSAYSWMPDSPLAKQKPTSTEKEPNNQQSQAQKITLPCDISGAFYPAADVDTFEFDGKRGDVWWIEVASQRLGLTTDPFVVVQRVTKDGATEKLSDVAELNDIPNPIDKAAYEAGSADVLGKLEIKDDGVYRLQLRDLFGGTRSNPKNSYRLMIRKAAPDFALVAWAFDAPNGPNYAQVPARPLALRGGGTMALQVAALRRDGFDGDIDLIAEGLPAGMTATGLKIPAGKTQGMILFTATEKAARAVANVKLTGRAQTNGVSVSRPCSLASIVWPVPNTAQEIPRGRLLDDVPVSISGFELSPLTIVPKENKVFEAKAGAKLNIPLALTWRGDHTTALKLKALTPGFEAMKETDIAVKAAGAEAVLDLAALKTAPGDYTLAFHVVAKGKHTREPEAVKEAKKIQSQALVAHVAASAEAKKLAAAAKAAPADKKTEAEAASKAAAEKQKTAEAAQAAANALVNAAEAKAKPKDFADIIVSEPVRISIKPADKK
jgi:hypothetical protein